MLNRRKFFMSEATLYLWTGLIGGMILSFIASVAANLFQADIGRLLTRGQKKWQIRSLAAEKNLYGLTVSLLTSPSLVGSYFARRIGHLVLSLACLTISAAMAVMVVAKDLNLRPLIISFLLISCGLLIDSGNRVFRISWRIDNFQEYRQRLVGRWPDETWPLPKTSLQSTA